MRKIFTLLFTVAVLFSSAQWNTIDHPVVDGGNINNFTEYGGNLYIGSDGGVFKSTDGGNTWAIVMEGYNEYGTYCDHLVAHSTGLIAISNGLLWLSTDGDTWSYIDPVGMPMNYSMADLSIANDIIYVTVEEDMGDVYLYFSADGVNFTQGFQFPGEYDLLYLNDTAQFIQNNDQLQWTTDGITMNTIDISAYSIEEGFGRTFKSESGGQYIYFIEGSGNLHRYDLTTQLWEDDIADLPTGTAEYMGLNVEDDVMFCSAISFMPLGVNLYKSVNHGVNWTMVADPGITPINMLERLYQMSSGNVISAGISGDVFVSSDIGETWTNGTDGFIASEHGRLIESNGALITFESQIGVMRSDDNGATWSMSNGGLTPFFTDLFFVTDIYHHKDEIFMIFQTDPFTGESGLYKSTDDGNNWSEITTIPDSIYMRFAGYNDSILIMQFLDDEYDSFTYQYTEDGGATWIDISANVEALMLNENYGFRGKGAELYLFGVNGSDYPTAFHSTDYGATWTEENTGLTGGSLFMFTNFDWGDKFHAEVIVDFTDMGRPIVAFGDWSSMEYINLYKLQGSGWNDLNSTGIDHEAYPMGCLKNMDDKWYFGTPKGVYVSEDAGVTFTDVVSMQEGYLPGISPVSLQISGTKIFAGTVVNGIWEADLPVSSQEITTTEQISIYPNPANNNIYVQSESNVRVSILDISGRELINTQNKSIDISSLNSGTYMIKVESAGQTQISKLIKL